MLAYPWLQVAAVDDVQHPHLIPCYFVKHAKIANPQPFHGRISAYQTLVPIARWEGVILQRQDGFLKPPAHRPGLLQHLEHASGHSQVIAGHHISLIVPLALRGLPLHPGAFPLVPLLGQSCCPLWTPPAQGVLLFTRGCAIMAE